MKICKNCGETNQNETVYCINCGKSSFDVGEETQCPHCGAANGKDFTHCTNCGNALTTAAVSVDQNVDGEASSDMQMHTLENYFADNSQIVSKETSKCFRCGTELQINSIFCYKCGAPVSTLHEHRVVERKICKYCDTPNLPENPYCSFCYGSLEDAKAEEFQLSHETVNVGKLAIKRAILVGTNGKYKICNNCGALDKQETDFCEQCGLSLTFREQKRFCPNCGSENEIDAKFCINCKWSFEADNQQQSEQWKCMQCENLNNQQNQFCIYCGEKKQ